jgi:hypothetical protein
LGVLKKKEGAGIKMKGRRKRKEKEGERGRRKNPPKKREESEEEDAEEGRIDEIPEGNPAQSPLFLNSNSPTKKSKR